VYRTGFDETHANDLAGRFKRNIYSSVDDDAILAHTSESFRSFEMSTPLIAVLPGRGHTALATLKALAAKPKSLVRVRVIVRDEAKKTESEKMFPGFECLFVLLFDA